MKVSKRLARWAGKNLKVNAGDKAAVRSAVAKALTAGTLTAARLKKLNAAKAPATAAVTTGGGTGGGGDADKTTTATVHNDPPGGGKGRDTSYPDVSAGSYFKGLSEIRVKEAADRYDDAKTAVVYPQFVKGTGIPHPRAGEPVTVLGRKLFHPSQRDLAVVGSFWKYAANFACRAKGISAPEWTGFRADEKELLQHCIHKSAWTGLLGADKNGEGGHEILGKLEDWQVKTLIADVNSGGLFAVPQAFDDAIVMYPILYGQLAPYVTMRDVKSNRVQGALMNRPRFVSGTLEGTAVQPFDTTGFISAFDTPIFNAQGSMELGKDFEDDSPAAVGQTVVDMFGQEALAWMDRVIAYGDGRNEPLGICRTPGLYAVLSSYGPGGPMTVADFTNLQFGIDLALRQEPNAYKCFISNDTMYRASRNIQVGPNDERRVFGMDTQSYNLLGDPYAINNNIPTGLVAYANLRRYRMYRRLGVQITIDDSGYTLRTRNTRLIVARMRYGGRLDYAGAAALMSDAQSQ